MAAHGWPRAMVAAVGGGLVIGAGQLGIGYGLGIIRWDTDFTSDSAWHAQLTWLAFLAQVAVVAGAASGRWLARRREMRAGLSGGARYPGSLVARLGLAIAAGVGGCVMLPLVVHQARDVRVLEPGDPALTAAIATLAGLVVGVLAAAVTLSVSPVAGNVTATVVWLWLAALVSAVWTIGSGQAWADARLGLLPLSAGWRPVLLLGAPALIALGVAAVARLGGGHPGAVAASGLAGPAMVAAAYLIGAPGDGAQKSTYPWALTGAAVGIAVSVLAAVARKPTLPARDGEPALSTSDIGDGTGSLGGTGGWRPSVALDRPATSHRAVHAGPGEVEDEQRVPVAAARGSRAAASLADPDPATVRPPGRSGRSKPEPEPHLQPKAQSQPTALSPPKARSQKAQSQPKAGSQPKAQSQPTAQSPSKAEPKPTPQPKPEPPTAQPLPEPRPEPEPRRGRRKRRDQRAEDEHVDWVRGLGGS